MRRNAVETILGAVVLAVAGLFVFFAYNTAQVQAVQGYPVSAAFYKVGGLNKGGDVRISGIKIGTVTELRLDTKTFDAVVTMSITPSVKLPTDTVAVIASEGVLGARHVRLEPGTADTFIAAGSRVQKTRDFRSLEDQVGEIIFLATGSSGKGSGAK